MASTNILSCTLTPLITAKNIILEITRNTIISVKFLKLHNQQKQTATVDTHSLLQENSKLSK